MRGSEDDFRQQLSVLTTRQLRLEALRAVQDAARRLLSTMMDHEYTIQKGDELLVLAFIKLLTRTMNEEHPLNGFQVLVPRVFKVFMPVESELREQLVRELKSGSEDLDESFLDQVRTDDKLVEQPFLWSGSGIKLFSDHSSLQSDESLGKILNRAMKEGLAIVEAYLQRVTRQAQETDVVSVGLGRIMKICLEQLLRLIEFEHFGLPQGTLRIVRLILIWTSKSDFVRRETLPAWTGSRISASAVVLDGFVEEFQRDVDSTEESEHIVLGLVLLCIQQVKQFLDIPNSHTGILTQSVLILQPSKLNAFSKLVPDIFSTHLAVGSNLRKKFNAAFDDSVQHLISATNQFVNAKYFWNDKEMPSFPDHEQHE